jgi:hypothetical protein
MFPDLVLRFSVSYSREDLMLARIELLVELFSNLNRQLLTGKPLIGNWDAC